MTLTNPMFATATRRPVSYREGVTAGIARWNANTDAAFARIDLAACVSDGVSAVRSLCETRDTTRRMIADGEISPREEFDEAIWELLSDWALMSREFLASIEACESEGVAIPHADEFRGQLDEVEKYLSHTRHSQGQLLELARQHPAPEQWLAEE